MWNIIIVAETGIFDEKLWTFYFQKSFLFLSTYYTFTGINLINIVPLILYVQIWLYTCSINTWNEVGTLDAFLQRKGLYTDMNTLKKSLEKAEKRRQDAFNEAMLVSTDIKHTYFTTTCT